MNEDSSFIQHLEAVHAGERRFENAFQAVRRMVLELGFKKAFYAGKTVYDFNAFRMGEKHLIGLYDEINSFVSYVKDAAEGGSSREMAYVLVGEPGNGKTFFVEYVSKMYRVFSALPKNQRFSFSISVNDLDGFGQIKTLPSQTFEDPLILAMNLFSDEGKNKEFLASIGFDEKEIEILYQNYRPLGACTGYNWNLVRATTNEKLKDMLSFVNVFPVPLDESSGVLTGKYPAKDKITSSSADLLGEESIQRLLHIADVDNPYRFHLRRGALARVAGGGIHFSDEIFKNKKDLVQVYLGVIQNRTIEIDGYKWPIDTLIIATSNNSEFDRFVSEKEEAPVIDRCRICFVGHNTNYILQKALTSYAIGSGTRTTVANEGLHQDPNLNFAASVAVTLTRMPKLTDGKLNPVEMMKLAAGEVAGEKSVKTLSDVIDDLSQKPTVLMRWGQKGLGQRDLGRAIQILIESTETNEGECMFAEDVFSAFRRVVLDYVSDSSDRAKYLDDLKIAKGLYRERIMTEMFNAYMDEPQAIRKDVMNYVNMIIGVDAENLGSDKTWKYMDPQSKKMKAIRIDEKFLNSVEGRLGLRSREQVDSFRTSIRKIYGQKISVEPNYDFMDNLELVKAVTDVRLKSDVAGAGSLIGALANRTNEENQKLYDRMITTMLKKLKYCRTCAMKTIEYFCTQETDETTV